MPGTVRSAEARTDPWITDSGVRFDDYYRLYNPVALGYARRLGAGDTEMAADTALLDTFQALDRLNNDSSPVTAPTCSER